MEGMQKAGLRLTKSQAILRLSLGNWKIRGNLGTSQQVERSFLVTARATSSSGKRR